MLFNSLHFLIFFPLFLLLYFRIPKRHQWKLLLASGYYFYGAFSPKYTLILVAITLNDYFAGLKIDAAASKADKKKWLFLSMAMNLGILFFFKYIDFADENIRFVFETMGLPYVVPEPWFNDIVVPVGVSFITFQSLSYTIDIYKGLIKPEKHLGYFAAFTAFWPVMVNGPIERAKNLIPQLREPHPFDYDRVKSGLFRMAWGLFKKVVVADRIAFYTDHMYIHYQDVSGWTIVLGAFFFLFQVYCDFSGYSDIALGTARVMGINVMENFRRPFFSKNLGDFWTRWHISLSTWLTDYVFFYLGAYKASGYVVVFNLIFVLSLCGLWHGANWPMVLSFTMVGIAMSVRFLWQKHVVGAIKPSNMYRWFDRYFPEWAHVVTTITILCFCFLLFRVHVTAQMINHSTPGMHVTWEAMGGALYSKLFHLGSAGFFTEWVMHKGIVQFVLGMVFVVVLLGAEYLLGDRPVEQVVLEKPRVQRWAIYALLVTVIAWFGVFNNTAFVYFQF